MVITEEQKERLIDVWQYCKTGTAKTKEKKVELINLYNEIYKTKYNPNSNCSSCLNTCYQGIKKLIDEI